ncbi:arylamine N-acetyltransferase family protein [Paenibacillus cymbidii]|uniref:arylamine N-acetyltransferase family protein n=1 Tax=Paenibacillus cymbidii TaxID=1639034 RepID=UPI001080FC17|nr:arylamine N-acetyltransferase [Paenibacillus cymbidii]
MTMNESVAHDYLTCLQAERQPPSLAYLHRLIGLHLTTFPFENISKFHYYTHLGKTGLNWLPDAEQFLQRFAGQGLGGNCYILNAHFGALLQALGFQASPVRATGGNTHLGLMVTVEGRSYYVDVGYGAPLFDPLALEEQPRFTRFREEVEISRLSGDQYRIDRRLNGNSLVAKCIEWRPAMLADFDEIIAHSLRDEDENPFMRRIVATLFRPDAAFGVVNRKLFVRTERGEETHEFVRRDDWLGMLRNTFGIERNMAEQALAFLEERDVRLF